MTFNENSTRTYRTNAALKQYQRVVKAGSNVAVAGLDDVTVGITVANANANDLISVHILSGQGSRPFIADGVIAQNAPVYPAAGGKVSATVHGNILGYAEEAAGADNDIIEVLLAGRIG